MRRAKFRHISGAVDAVQTRAQPESLLAAVQSVWEESVGVGVSRQTRLLSEREGNLTVACSSSVWTQELELMSKQLIKSINDHLGGEQVSSLRFITGLDSCRPADSK